MSLIHNVDIDNELKAVIEIPYKSTAKYEIDKESGLFLRLDRILNTAVPEAYGFIPQTLSKDGDPLDVFVLSPEALVPLTIVKIEIFGVVMCLDSDVPDEKILSRVVPDQSLSSEQVKIMQEQAIKSIVDYLKAYKEGMQVKGVLGKQAAEKIITAARIRYADSQGEL